MIVIVIRYMQGVSDEYCIELIMLKLYFSMNNVPGEETKTTTDAIVGKLVA